jgi:predicted HAD superfamily Cof-like phosphohydrolase
MFMPVPPRPGGLVREFHAAFGLGIGGRPAEISPVLAAHRQGLLGEEVTEVAEALNDGGLTNGAQQP